MRPRLNVIGTVALSPIHWRNTVDVQSCRGDGDNRHLASFSISGLVRYSAAFRDEAERNVSGGRALCPTMALSRRSGRPHTLA